jgi:predicted  nucleic acid-binding Zn-ribbon protein
MAYNKHNWSEMQAKEIPLEAKHLEELEAGLIDVINKVGEVTTAEVATWYDSTFELGDKKHLMTAIDKLPLKENKAYTVILTDKNDREFIYELSLVDSEAVNGITGYKMIYFGDLLLDLDNDEGFALIQDGVAVDENCTIKSAPNKTGVLLVGYKKAVVKETHFTTSTQKVIVQDEEYAKAIQDKIDRGIEKANKDQLEMLHVHLESQIEDLEKHSNKKFEAIDKKLDTFEDTIEEHREDINNQVIEINDQVIEINDQLLEIAGMLKDTDVEQLAELIKRIDGIDSLTSNHTSQIASLNQQATTQASQIDTLNARTENLNTFVTTLETQTEALDTRATALEAQAADLVNADKEITSQIEEQNTKVIANAEKITTIESLVSEQGTQLTGLDSQLDNVANQVDLIQDDYASLSTVQTKDDLVLTEAKAYTDQMAANSGAKIIIKTWEATE